MLFLITKTDEEGHTYIFGDIPELMADLRLSLGVTARVGDEDFAQEVLNHPDASLFQIEATQDGYEIPVSLKQALVSMTSSHAMIGLNADLQARFAKAVDTHD